MDLALWRGAYRARDRTRVMARVFLQGTTIPIYPAPSVNMPLMQPDLFAAPSPALPGLSLARNIVTTDEERSLVAAIDGVALSPFRFHGWIGKRLTVSFGWKYDFDNASFGPTDPIPGFLHFLRARAAAFAGLAECELVQAILIRYDPGAGIGWHRDRDVFNHVIGVSLGTPAIMRFRRRIGTIYKRASALLEPRSVYHLSGEARHVWEHSIAPMEQARLSVTFRTLS